MNIKLLSKDDQPRERAKRKGFFSLSDSELLALILQKGSKNQNVLELSNYLMARYGFEKMNNCSIYELMKVKGIGEAKAIQILALFELFKRFNRQKRKINTRIKTPKDVYDYFVDYLKNKKKEFFYVLLLNSKNDIIRHKLISIGTLNQSLIHPREVFKTAMKNSANSIILVHNHPSGDVEPSKEDIEVTNKFVEIGKLVNINVLDHVIIGDEYFRSIL
ncbi:DNA repair protein RadC [Candidatus Woesearchaeota archaeon]|nr:DNA repair protein RadC [Candidatus Woesearchaeota archaeon]